MPYIGKKPENIIATAVDSTTGDFSGNVTAGGTLAVTGETTLATHLNMGDGDIIKLGASADLTIQHDGSNSIIKDGGTGNLQIQADDFKIMNAAGDENILFGAEDGTVRLFHNNVTKFETTSSGVTVVGDIANYSGDLTLDVAGDISLDADGGDIHFKDGGTVHGNFLLSGTDFTIGSSQNNGDLIFRGIDGGADITALTLDMSAGGLAIFNAGVALGGTGSANTLDDYEEGTWTPTANTGLSYGFQQGRYIKVGNLVLASFDIDLDSVSASGNILQGLPFTTGNFGGNFGIVNIGYYSSITTGVVWLSGYTRTNLTSLYFTGNSSSHTTIQHNTFNVFNDTTRILGNLIYHTN